MEPRRRLSGPAPLTDILLVWRHVRLSDPGGQKHDLCLVDVVSGQYTHDLPFFHDDHPVAHADDLFLLR